jgi:sugar phosphate isomerase/epimerase
VIRSAVTISLVPEARGGPFVFWDDLEAGCRRAAELGFDAVEIFPPGPEALPQLETRALLDRHRLRLAAVGSGAGWVKHRLSLTSPDAAVREKGKQFIRSLIGAAAAFEAPVIVGSMQGRWGDGVGREAADKYLADALLELSRFAFDHDTRLLYEPLNRYETNLFNSLSDAAGFLTRIGADDVRLLADLYHMNIEERDLAAALRDNGRWLGHVHLADSNRHPAGGGHTDFRPIGKALRDIGYDGYVSAEALPLPDSDSAARRTIEAFRRYFAQD